MPSPKDGGQNEKISAAVEAMIPLAKRTAELGCKLGLYNHGGWGGEPENLVAVCEHLKERGVRHVGIVYNFHHAHDQIDAFNASLAKLQPWLLCLNLNGMRDAKQVEADAKKHKIVPIGSGDHETRLIQQIIDSKYRGPIGIIGHQADNDVEIVLKQNLTGLERILHAPHRPSADGR